MHVRAKSWTLIHQLIGALGNHGKHSKSYLNLSEVARGKAIDELMPLDKTGIWAKTQAVNWNGKSLIAVAPSQELKAESGLPSLHGRPITAPCIYMSWRILCWQTRGWYSWMLQRCSSTNTPMSPAQERYSLPHCRRRISPTTAAQEPTWVHMVSLSRFTGPTGLPNLSRLTSEHDHLLYGLHHHKDSFPRQNHQSAALLMHVCWLRLPIYQTCIKMYSVVF